MKQLPLEFRKNTYDYKQVWRDEDYAIYSQSFTGNLYAYEVFKINKNKESEAFGHVFEASETVPPSTQWGKNAYTVATMEDANEKIAQMREAALKSKDAIPETN